MILLAPLLLLPGGPSGGPDYPIDPVPLRTLIDRAELIARVVPGPSRRLASELGHWNNHEAELTIVEVLRGPVQADGRVMVRFSGDMLCPTPASYTEGKTHLVFLDRDDEGRWKSVALSYGSKQLEEAAQRAYCAAIRRYLALDAMPIQSAERILAHDAAKIEWVVSVAENPHTRWEGAVELDPDRYLPTGFSEDDWVYGFDDLSEQQKARLIRALCTGKVDHPANRLLYRALEASADPRLMRWLVDFVAGWAEDPIYGAGDWVLRLADRLDDEQIRMLVDRHWPPRRECRHWDDAGGGSESRVCLEIVELARAKLGG